MFNPDKVKKGDILGIVKYSRKVLDYVPVKYKVYELVDIDKFPNIKKKGVTHMIYMESPKKRVRELRIFRNNMYYVLDAYGKVYSKGNISKISNLSNVNADFKTIFNRLNEKGYSALAELLNAI